MTIRRKTMQFDVTVQRTEYREHTFLVEADNRDAAFHAGLEAANDYDFYDSPVDSAREAVTAIVPVTTNNDTMRNEVKSNESNGYDLLPCPFCGAEGSNKLIHCQNYNCRVAPHWSRIHVSEQCGANDKVQVSSEAK
jgi:hypothetical protein